MFRRLVVIETLPVPNSELISAKCQTTEYDVTISLLMRLGYGGGHVCLMNVLYNIYFQQIFRVCKSTM